SKDDGGGGFHRSITVETPTSITMEIYHACMHLFQKHYAQKTVRQISVSLGNVVADEHVQLQLFDKDRTSKRKLGYVMDALRQRYGKDALLRAVSWTPAGTARKRSQLV